MNRTEARALWARVAAGDLAREQYDSVDLWAWIQHVAQQVLAADDEPMATVRPYKLTEALGLRGPEDRKASLRALVAEWQLIADLGGEEPRPRAVDWIYQRAIERDLLTGVYREDAKKAKDEIRKLLPK